MLLLYVSEKQKDVTARNEKKVFSQKSGEKTGTTRRVSAEFRRGGIPDWASEKAVSMFEMRGKSADIPAGQWLCTYDSVEDQLRKGWTDEERALIEETLAKQNDVRVVEREKVAAPYKMYDQHRKVVGKRTVAHAAKDIREAYESAGFDVAQAVAYEKQEGGPDALVAALEALVAPEPEEELVAA